MRNALITGLLLSSAFALASDVPLMFHHEVLAKAKPDECFFGLGNTNNYYSSDGIDCDACRQAGGQPRVNQSYVWGLAKSGDDLWFGTGANIYFLTVGFAFGTTNSSLSTNAAAEFGRSPYVRSGQVPPQLGDWRPPQIYCYGLSNRSLTRLDTTLPPQARDLLNSTVGFRSAGASPPTSAHSNGVVILAGPLLPPQGRDIRSSVGIAMFAFDARTRTLLRTRVFGEYATIRKWLVHEGVLYTGVTAANNDGGRVLRWINDPAHPDYPLAFTVVGNLDTGGANIAVHEGRLFVSTWPVQSDNPVEYVFAPKYAGIYVSPLIPPGGLTAGHAGGWSKFWDISDYDSDLLCNLVTAVGDLRSYGGYLYWGTMNLPGYTDTVHSSYFGPPATTAERNTQLANTFRAISLFRASNFRFNASPARADVELLYGETNLASRNVFTKAWSTNLNNTGKPPKFGRSGFGNVLNGYTWTMQVYNNQLFVGTLDISPVATRLDPNDGADLWCFPTPNEEAKPVSTRGIGNYANYGVRTILSDSNSLYLGMANPLNLLTATNDLLPEGGWELVRLTQRYADRDWDGLSDGFETQFFGNPTNASPTQNSDGDSHNNLAEFVAGTDPKNTASRFKLTNTRVSVGGGVSFDWPGLAGREYRVHRTTNSSGAWTVLTNLTGGNTTMTFSLPPGADAGFFRVSVELGPAAGP